MIWNKEIFWKLKVLVKYMGLNTIFVILNKGFNIRFKKKFIKINTEYGVFNLLRDEAEIIRLKEFEDQYLLPAKKEDVILDLGLNIGMSAAFFYNIYKCKIIGVEPIKRDFERAVEHKSINNINKLILINKALWYHNIDKIKINAIGTSSYVKELNRRQKPEYEEECETITLEELLKYKPTIIKCDIEGAEEVFLKMNKQEKEYIKNNIKYMVFEIHKNEDIINYINCFESLGFIMEVKFDKAHPECCILRVEKC
jgi:FkbM family methyltransferase